MKLWLQVLFAQGYLWRDRFPDLFPADAHLSGERPSLWQIAFGLLFLVGGVLNALVYSPSLLTVIHISIGIGLSFPLIAALGLNRLFGDAALWVSLSWATGTLGLAGIVALVTYSFVTGSWLTVALFLAFLALPAAPTINGILSRYLFFADPHSNAHRLDDAPTDRAQNFWVETYWRLPLAAIRLMFRRPKAAA
jgi:hypothetical protein